MTGPWRFKGVVTEIKGDSIDVGHGGPVIGPVEVTIRGDEGSTLRMLTNGPMQPRIGDGVDVEVTFSRAP